MGAIPTWVTAGGHRKSLITTMKRLRRRSNSSATNPSSSFSSVGPPFEAALMYDAMYILLNSAITQADLSHLDYNTGFSGDVRINANGNRQPYFIGYIVNNGNFTGLRQIDYVKQSDSLILSNLPDCSTCTWQGRDAQQPSDSPPAPLLTPIQVSYN